MGSVLFVWIFSHVYIVYMKRISEKVDWHKHSSQYKKRKKKKKKKVKRKPK